MKSTTSKSRATVTSRQKRIEALCVARIVRSTSIRDARPNIVDGFIVTRVEESESQACFFIEVERTQSLEPCSKRGKRIPGSWKSYPGLLTHILR